MTAAQVKTVIPEPDYRGKVRDIYVLGDKLLLVSSDRFSAFDVVFNEPVPEKGILLNQISAHWFSLLPRGQHHFLTADYRDFPAPFNQEHFAGRSALVLRTERIPFECVVRGFLLGSGFREYRAQGTLAQQKLPPGLKKGERLAEPAFTPAIKNDSGHDENIAFSELQQRLPQWAEELRTRSIALYQKAFAVLEKKGIYLLDTKFEFGLREGRLLLIDEILTPDSSRFADADEYEAALRRGGDIPTLDKQIVRDYLEKIGWDKAPPPPALPQEITEKMRAAYCRIRDVVLSITPQEFQV